MIEITLPSELTVSNGNTYKFEDFGKRGDKIEIYFINEDGEKMKYTIKVSYSKARLVMN